MCPDHRRWPGGRGGRSSVERNAPKRRPGLAAAVGRLVHHLARAFLEIDRLEDVEVEGVFDVAARVARREFDVDDVAVLAVVRVDLAERRADDLLVLADARPRESAEGG